MKSALVVARRCRYAFGLGLRRPISTDRVAPLSPGDRLPCRGPGRHRPRLRRSGRAIAGHQGPPIAEVRQAGGAVRSGPVKVISPSRIARYFFHECPRYLRYSSTPKELWDVEGVPAPPFDHSPVTAAILEGGYTWEEEVVRNRLAGPGPASPTRRRARG